MENKLEQLLNSLIEKGWKPFGKGGLNLRKLNGIHKGWLLLHEPSTRVADNYSLRDIVSKSSGLWQFVCENEMIKIEYGKIREKYDETAPTTDKNKVITYRQLLGEDNYEYRLIESSLKDESELEDFLLSNIKIEGNDL